MKNLLKLLCTIFLFVVFLFSCSAAMTEFPPNQAIVLETDVSWTPSGWAGRINTDIYSLDVIDGVPHFSVGEAKKRKVWIHYLGLPIDFNQYPIAVITYCAENTDTEGGAYVIWLDDGRGPNGGGISVFRSNQLITDNRVHELRKDVRELNPAGPFITVALGVMCGDTAPATFDLVGLRFEADPETEAFGPASTESSMAAVITDLKGDPVDEAIVVIDKEWKNRARSAITDENGKAAITPFENSIGKHTVTVEKAGMFPVTITVNTVGRPKPLEVTIGPGLHYGGVIKDENDSPVAGAKIKFNINFKETNAYKNIKRWHNLSSDTEGRWRTPLLPDQFDNFRCTIKHPEFAEKRESFQYSRDKNYENLEIVLPTPLRLSGMAIDVTTGEPIPGFKFYVLSGGAYTEHSCKDDGTFSIPVSPGQVQLNLNQNPRDVKYLLNTEWRKKDWRLQEKYYNLFQGNISSAKTDLVFESPCYITHPVSGFVVDSESNPIKDCKVYSGFESKGVREQTTDDSGHFKFDLLPKEKAFDLFAISADKKLAAVAHVDTGSVAPVEITVIPTRDFKGKVVDCDGMGVGKMRFDVDLKLNDESVYRVRQTITTDTASNFVLRNVCHQASYRAWWRSDNDINRDFDYGDSTFSLSEISDTQPITITAKRYIECLMGTVVDEDGGPVAGAKITTDSWGVFQQSERDKFMSGGILSDENGFFEMSRLAKDKMNLTITHKNYKGKTVPDVATDSIDLQIVLKPKGDSLVSVDLKDEADNPITSARVVLYSKHYYSSNDTAIISPDRVDKGLYEFTSFKPDEKRGYNLLVDVPGHYYFCRGIDSEMDNSFDVVLKKATTPISGIITDSKGKPLLGVEVIAANIASAPYTRGQRGGYLYPRQMTTTLTDTSGIFTFPRFSPDDSISFNITCDGYAMESSHSSTLKNSSNGIQLQPEARIKGKVVYKETGEPAPNVTVRCNSSGRSNSRGNAQTDENGEYIIKQLKAVEFRVTAYDKENREKPSWIAKNIKMNAEAGKDNTAPDILVQQGALIKGKVSDESYLKNSSRRYIQIKSDQKDYNDWVKIEDNNQFQVRVLPGKIKFFAMDQNQRCKETPCHNMEVEEGKTYEDVIINPSG
jgi:hypothetical protein